MVQLNIKQVKITIVRLDKDGKPISRQIVTKKGDKITGKKEDMNGRD